MEFSEYQSLTKETAIYPGHYAIFPKDGILYTALGLASEAGEVAGKVKKILRDEHGIFNPVNRHSIIGEMGDCLWYLSELASMLNVDLNEIALNNLAKLSDRKERDTLKGSGDNR